MSSYEARADLTVVYAERKPGAVQRSVRVCSETKWGGLAASPLFAEKR